MATCVCMCVCVLNVEADWYEKRNGNDLIGILDENVKQRGEEMANVWNVFEVNCENEGKDNKKKKGKDEL